MAIAFLRLIGSIYFLLKFTLIFSIPLLFIIFGIFKLYREFFCVRHDDALVKVFETSQLLSETFHLLSPKLMVRDFAPYDNLCWHWLGLFGIDVVGIIKNAVQCCESQVSDV
jgi:hypothetical protein